MKRLFDIVGALTLLVLLLPIFVVVSILIKISSRGPVFYRQKRVGKGFAQFRIYKFRTMYVNQNFHALTLHDDSRITPLGKLLRRYHIDEFPQLIDVLFGRMSFIGPRPMILNHLSAHQEQWAQILSDCKPGITGLGSILYAEREYTLLARSDNPISAYENIIQKHKIRLELFYIKKRGILLDAKILWWTFKKFLGLKR